MVCISMSQRILLGDFLAYISNLTLLDKGFAAQIPFYPHLGGGHSRLEIIWLPCTYFDAIIAWAIRHCLLFALLNRISKHFDFFLVFMLPQYWRRDPRPKQLLYVQNFFSADLHHCARKAHWDAVLLRRIWPVFCSHESTARSLQFIHPCYFMFFIQFIVVLQLSFATIITVSVLFHGQLRHHHASPTVCFLVHGTEHCLVVCAAILRSYSMSCRPRWKRWIAYTVTDGVSGAAIIANVKYKHTWWFSSCCWFWNAKVRLALIVAKTTGFAGYADISGSTFGLAFACVITRKKNEKQEVL